MSFGFSEAWIGWIPAIGWSGSMHTMVFNVSVTDIYIYIRKNNTRKWENEENNKRKEKASLPTKRYDI